MVVVTSTDSLSSKAIVIAIALLTYFVILGINFARRSCHRVPKVPTEMFIFFIIVTNNYFVSEYFLLKLS